MLSMDAGKRYKRRKGKDEKTEKIQKKKNNEKKRKQNSFKERLFLSETCITFSAEKAFMKAGLVEVMVCKTK